MSAIRKQRHPWRRRLLRWAAGLASLYIVLVLALVALEDRFVYLPDTADESWSDPEGLRVEDVELRGRGGTRLHAWWCPVEGARTAILLCHGQRGNLSHRGWLVARLQGLGASVLIFDYPGYGRSAGRPSEAGGYAAAVAAYDWLVETQKVPPQQVVLVGISLGGAVATDLAARRPHRALVLCMTFTSLPDVAQRFVPVVPARWLMRNRFDSLAKIGRCRGPVFITHGSADWRIPPSHAERLYAATPGLKRYFVMEGVSHDGPVFTDECLEELRSFLRGLDIGRGHHDRAPTVPGRRP